ncbi:hypothetical protein PTMSG1_08536 [Pyrenophora teres f. maculata]|nr:hypothetical protein PTMSG1_08536 [Pyrenophora teres f. maculata]
MQPRLLAFAAAFRGPLFTARIPAASPRQPRTTNFVCQRCLRKFSTSPTLRLLGKSSQKAADKERKYPSRLLIYDAGDARTTWISFWKAMALLQFGTTLVFGVPPLWNNENQPDPNVRKMQAILVGILGTIPTLTLAYLTAPFTHQIFLQIPPSARSSLPALQRFARNLRTHPHLTANTKLEFVTLRIFPFRKHTTTFLHELRALPSSRFRLANIELPKSAEWRERQKEKGWGKRMWEVLNEQRFKFYVKEGRAYTVRTGVPGVWEEVAERIREQSAETEEGGKEGKMGKGTGVGGRGLKSKSGAVAEKMPALRVEERMKRQTTRVVKR